MTSQGFAFFAAAALKGSAALALAWAIAFAMRRSSAAARHLVWTAAGAAVLALPFLSVSLPELRVPAAPVIFQAIAATATGDATGAVTNPARPAHTPAVPTRRLPDWRAWI